MVFDVFVLEFIKTLSRYGDLIDDFVGIKNQRFCRF